MDNLISLEHYLNKGKVLLIPFYQRGYIWGKNNTFEKNAIEFILGTIVNGFNNSKNEDIFLQGITVSESDTNIELIDGQQRTTFFYLLLCYLGYEKNIQIEYAVREESGKFLKEIKKLDRDSIRNLCDEKEDEDSQDLFYFKKTIRLIHQQLNSIYKEKLKSYILEHIKFLYINIPKDKAIKTFTMMNGSKAIMLSEELIKAEMLRQISLKSENEVKDFTTEWETNALRSRYAREWDKWFYWWNKVDVRYFFKINNPMGILLEFYYWIVERNESFNFNHFRHLLSTTSETRIHFKGLRRLQKSIEDIFNNPIIYNLLGVSLKDSGNDKFKIILFFIENKHDITKLEEFTKWRVVGATYKEITSNTIELTDSEVSKESKARIALYMINQKFVYNSDGDSFARKYLLYLNILEDNKANNNDGRKFNFKIFDKQSLEHIHPKSKVFHKDGEMYRDGNDTEIGIEEPNGDEWLNRDKCPSDVSEHSIGNLVLLEGSNNSTFGNKTFNEKKNIYFDLKINFKSRELLHTISVFAKEKWGIDEIVENQKNIISQFEKNYKLNEKLNTQNDE